MHEAGAKKAELQPQDQETMKRLAGEVQDRVDEMAAIAVRTLGIDADGFVAKFAPVAGAPDADARVVAVEIIDLPDGTSGCWVTTSDGGGFCESPCGSA
jgi:hypothetical protein